MCIDKPIRARDITPCNKQGKLRTSRGLTSTIHFPFIRTIVATVCGRQADRKSVTANTRINKFVAVRSLAFRSRAKQIRKFPTNAVTVIRSIIPDSIAMRYVGLDASCLKYFGASHQYVSYKSVVGFMEVEFSMAWTISSLYVWLSKKALQLPFSNDHFSTFV